MKTKEVIHSDKRLPSELWFTIVYMVDGKTTHKIVSSPCYSDAKQYCENLGEFVACQYIETAPDLVYCH